MTLTDEEAIDNVNPFVAHDFSLPGSVRQSGGYDDFTEIRSEPGIQKPKRSVYCEYGLCAESTSDCYLDRPLIPHRNIDTGFTKQKKRGIIEKVKVGVSNHPEFSMIGGGLIITSIIVMIYYTRR
tara:strand:- start:3948 stop:4322 length:375 start_codon:yes stop_codon:yes gene_type:complete